MIAPEVAQAERPELFKKKKEISSAKNILSARHLSDILTFIRPKALQHLFNHSVLYLAVSTIKEVNLILPCYSPSISSVQATDKHI